MARSKLLRAHLLLLTSVPWFIRLVGADQIIYSDDALSTLWQDWSWGSTIDYQATNIAEGSSSISINSGAWAALSLKSNSPNVGDFAGLRFDISVSTFRLSKLSVL